MNRIGWIWVGLAVLGVLGCGDTKPRTQVLIRIDADSQVQDMAREVRLDVFGRSAAEVFPNEPTTSIPVSSQDTGWPITHALQPRDNDVTRIFRVQATALNESGEEVAYVRAISGYLRERTLELTLRFYAACLFVDACEQPDESCGEEGSCESAQRDPRFLCDLAQGCDAGTGSMDATVGGDGGVGDGGARCEIASDCDDRVACTDDLCDNGTCRNAPNDALCTAGTEGRCDVASGGCQYAVCEVGVTCVAGPCQSATCSGSRCVYEDQCNASEDCCEDNCVPLGCSDGNDCTDDSCSPTGCKHQPLTDVPCESDEVFCNGAELCADGNCQSSGDPCSGSATCDESGQMCVGCMGDADCAPEVPGPWGPCEGFGDACDETGMQTREVMFESCFSGMCATNSRTESQSCSRVTEGTTCSTTTTEWSGVCEGNLCAPSGSESGTRTAYTCQSESCTPTNPQPITRPCTPPCFDAGGPPPLPDAGGGCVPSASNESLSTCGDNMDNDCDGFVDCDDVDCCGTFQCGTPPICF